MLKKVVGAISAAKIGQMLLNIGKDAVQAASDLQEVQNVVDVTFGETGAAKIEAWAKKAGNQFGLTETQAKRFTSTLGAMMKSAGMTGDEIVSMSTDLAGLTADMASFYNLDFDTAFQKIRSGISGETEPLKQLGINMSVANLNAFALQKGLQKTFDEMTQGEQTMLRYQYLMQATADAQGDFARTSDGYANAMRQIETNIESLKTKLGDFLLPTISDIVATINQVFASDVEWTRRHTVLDDIADIDAKTQTALEDVKAAQTHVDELTKVLREIAGDNEAQTNLLALGTDSAEAVKGLEELGLSTEEIEAKQSAWLETCKELVNTIPGLSGIIDTNTGEIKGGIPAIKEYADEWARAAMYQAQLQGLQEKKELVSGLPAQKDLELAARQRAAEAIAFLKAYENATEEQAKGIIEGARYLAGYSYQGTNADSIGQIGYEQLAENAHLAWDSFYGGEWGGGISLAPNEKTVKALQDYIDAEYDLQEFLEVQPALVEAYDAAIAQLAEEYGISTEEVEANLLAQQKAQEITQEMADAAAQAASALEEYSKRYSEIRATVSSSVNSNISGFKEMKLAATVAAEAANDYKTYAEALGEAAVSEEEWVSTIKDKNNQITAQSMKQALDSQLAFIEEYKKNLEDVKNTGAIDKEILAQLSDGSQESAQYLHAMAEAARSGDTKALTELNNAWKAVNDGKETFVDTLTQQKLAVDENYDAMVKKAEEAAKALDVSGTASQSTANNITAMAQAIKDHVSDVTAAVDSVLAELNRLNEWGVTIDYGFGASTVIQPSVKGAAGLVAHPLAVGMDWIPFDGFLATLHEGEAVLTAEENRIWQQFKNNQRGVDYETLGGVMRDSIHPGGDVYLDGRIVGSVVSQMQGNQYRTMQRSGWQQ